MKNTSTIVTFIVSFLVVGSMALIFLVLNDQKEQDVQPEPAVQVKPEPNPAIPQEPTVDSLSEREVAEQTDTVIDLSSPDALANAIAKALQTKDADVLQLLETRNAITAEQKQKLLDLIAKGNAGDLSLRGIAADNQGDRPRARYLLDLGNGTQGYVDLRQNAQKQWQVEQIVLPGDTGEADALVQDALGVATAFIQAVSKADFHGARRWVDRSKVQDATVVGMCILFEEGAFKMRDKAPIKSAYTTDTNAGYFVHLQDAAGKAAGNIGLTVAKTGDQWLVAEASLDSMLQAFAERQGAGDDIFIPIVKNPQGGDSLALFFGFDQDTLSNRSIRQLEIVAQALKAKDGKNLEISGHTDDVGGVAYNQGLSERRANAVRDQLIRFGVPGNKIVTKGFGKNQPRRVYSNTLNAKELEEVRQENRRAEMYLDF